MPVWMLKYAPHLLVLVALVGGGWYYGHTRYVAGENHVQEQWAVAIAKAEQAAREKEQADAAVQKEMIDALRNRATAAESVSRTQSDRLRDYETTIRRLSQAPRPAPSIDGAADQPADTGEIERLIGQIRGTRAELDSACSREQVNLSGWQEWWARVGD